MKKISVILVIMFSILMMPVAVKADTFEPFFTGDEVASVGEEVEFTISLRTDMQVNKFEAVLKYDSKILEFLSITKEDNWTVIKTDNASELQFSNTTITGETTVATLKFRVKNNSTYGNTVVKLEDLKLSSAEEVPTIKLSENISKTIKLRSDDNLIKTIRINDKNISGFNPTTYFYTLEVEPSIETIKIESTLNDESATFFDDFGEREVNLNYGANTILMKTKSESGKQLVYTLNIIRKDDRVVNNDLKTLIINGGVIKLNFDKSVLSYTVKTYKLDTLDVVAAASDSEAEIKVDAPKDLIIGENYVTITVTAVTGDKKDYKIIIINRDQPTDTRLKSLHIKGSKLSPEFDNNVYEYTVMYNESFKNGITLYKTSISSDVEITVIGDGKVKPGSVIKVVVTAVDGSDESIYLITVKSDNRINFFCLLEVIILIVLAILVIIQVNKKKKKQIALEQENIEEELSKTKEIKL